MVAKKSSPSRSSRSGSCGALVLAPAPLGGSDAQQQRAVGLQSTGGEQVDGAHLGNPKPASRSLIGQRGVDEAVEQHDRALLEQRIQALVHELCAGGGVEQRLGARGRRTGRGL